MPNRSVISNKEVLALNFEPFRASYTSLAQFEKEVFDHFVTRQVREEIAGVTGDALQYSPGEVREERGELAARAVVAPAYALGFSLLGAITHTIKLAVLIVGLLAIHPAIMARRPIIQTAVAAVVGLVLAAGVAQAYPRGAEEHALGRSSPFWSAVAAGQAASYPVNEWVRRKLLAGFAFGVLSSGAR